MGALVNDILLLPVVVVVLVVVVLLVVFEVRDPPFSDTICEKFISALDPMFNPVRPISTFL